MFPFIVGLGALAALIFALGIIKGAIGALHARHQPEVEGESDAAEEGRYAWTAAVAVAVSAAVIALAGVAPGFIYLGPLLAIGTAAGVGAAFLIGDRA